MDTIRLEYERWEFETAEKDGTEYIVFGMLAQDHTPSNPLEDWDGMGKIYSANRRHVNFHDDIASLLFDLACPVCGETEEYSIGRYDDFLSLSEDLYDDDEKKLETGTCLTDPVGYCWNCCAVANWDQFNTETDAVALSYFEHGLCKWAPAGSISYYPDFHWDGVRFAGVWVPDDEVLAGAPNDEEERRAWLLRQCEISCNYYTDWLNGSVYGYVVEVYEARREGENLFDDRDDYRLDGEVESDSCWGFYGFDLDAIKDHVNPTLEDYGLEVSV